MTISDHIVIGDNIRFCSEKILREIRHGKKADYPVWFAVTTTDVQTAEPMYILPSFEFWKKYYWEHNLRLLGLAGSRREAHLIVKTLIESALSQGQLDSLKEFLRDY